MHRLKLYFLFVVSLVPLLGSAVEKNKERVQIWQLQDEEPLNALSLDPVVKSVRWLEGDVEIIFNQAAPCGSWLPVNPVWKVSGTDVVLSFTWAAQFPNTASPTALCKKYVRAWVFGVPKGNYKVSFAAGVPLFRQVEGKIVTLPGR